MRAGGHLDVSLSDVEKLKYAQLQATLAARKLSTLGKKHELVQRLKEALKLEQSTGATVVSSSDGLLSSDASSLGAEQGEEAIKAQLRERLEVLPYKEIVQQLTLRLLNASGRKTQLIDRLVDAMYDEMTGQDPLRARAATPSSVGTGGTLEAGSNLEALVAALEPEPYARLRTLLQQRGLPSAGRKEVLVRRLAEALLAEQQQLQEQKVQKHINAPAKTASMLVVDLVNQLGGSSMKDATAGLLGAMERLSDVELAAVLEAIPGQVATEYTGRPELMARVGDAVMRLAASKSQQSGPWQEVQLRAMEDQMLLQREADERQRQSSRVDDVPDITAVDAMLEDLQNMPLSSLRAALRQQGLSDKGSKAELQARLQTALREQPGVEMQLQQMLNVQLERMSLLELLNAALDQEWDVAAEISSCPPLTVARSLMKDRCRRHIAELGSRGEKARWVLDFALKRVQRRMLEPKDPPTSVTVIFSAPHSLLPGALEGVCRVIEALHTRQDLGLHSSSFNFPSCLPHVLQTSKDAAAVARDKQSAHAFLEEARKGVAVEVMWIEESGQVFELPLNYVMTCSPITLVAECGTKASRCLDSLQALSEHLASSSPRVVLPILLGGGQQSQKVLEALDGVGAAYVGTTPGPASAVLRKDRLQEKLTLLGYPSQPTLTITSQQASDSAALAAMLQQWVAQHGWADASKQALVVKPTSGSGSLQVLPVRGYEAAAEAVQALHTECLNGDDVMVELYWLRERLDGKKAVEFSVSVIEGPGGPVAFLPIEVELWDLERQIFDADVDLLEWQMMQEGQTAEVIREELQDARATAQLDAQLDVMTPIRIALPNQQVRLHSPPRLSRKTVHHVRHAATKLFQQLGLRDFATFDGFMLLDPKWEAAYEPNPDDPYPTIPDPSPAVLDILMKQEAEQRAKEVLPLDTYCDTNTHKVDLDAFDPTLRCFGPEATIHFFDINTHLDPLPGSMLCLQAAEMGITPSNLLRNLVNRALSRAGCALLLPDEEVEPAPTAADMDVGLDEEVDGKERVYTKDYNWLAEPADYARVEQYVEVDEQDAGVEELDLYDDTALPNEWLEESFTPPAGWKSYEQAQAEQEQSGMTEEAVGLDDMRQQERILSNSEASTSSAADVQGPDCKERVRPRVWYKLVKSQTERGQAFQPELFTNQMFFDVPGFKDSSMNWQLKRVDHLQDRSKPGTADEVSGELEAALWGEEEIAEGGIVAGSVNDSLLERRKVWLLVGGDDSQRHASVAAGVNLWSKLHRLKDLQVELVLLSPMASGLNFVERRQNLLKRRVELRAWGFREEDLPATYQLPSIRYPVVSSPSVADRLVWIAPPAHFLRGNADEVAEQCERTYALSSVSEYSLPELSQQRLHGQVEAQMELHTAGLQGVASLWNGRPDGLPPAPVRMDLGRLLSMAKKHKAVVLNMVRGGFGADGCIERLMQHLEVMHTGSSWTSCQACWDKMALQEALMGMEENGVYVTPRVELATDTLIGGSIAVDEAADLLQAVQVSLDDATTLVVKPNMEAGGCGVAVLSSPQDVQLYFEAFRQGWPMLRANSLSTPHPAITLPPFMPTTFLFEPYIPADRIHIDTAGGFTWARQEEGNNPWVEVSLTFMGQLGNLKVLPPSLIAWTEENSSTGSSKVRITPIPSWCASPEATSECMLRAGLVADRLGFQGIVVLDAFMHCETGELYVLEANTQPDLGTWSPVFAQACIGSGYSPVDLAQQLVHQAVSPAPLVETAPAPLPQSVSLDEDEELLGAIDLFGDEAEEAGVEDAVGPDAFIDTLTDDVDDETYQSSDILYKEGVGEQDDLADDDAFDEDDSLFSFTDR